MSDEIQNKETQPTNTIDTKPVQENAKKQEKTKKETTLAK